MSQNFNISSFLHTLEQNQPKTGGFKGKTDVKIEKVYLSHPDWQGKYQILPMISAESGQPFAFLQKVREIKLPRKVTLQSGEEKENQVWMKILPAEAYTMQTPDGQIVSSLTAADEELLSKVQTSFDILYDELGGNSKERNADLNKTVGFMRRRNYTLFYGRCINHWGSSDPRNPKHQNFSGLFICSAKGFPETIKSNINDSIIQYGDPAEWSPQVYSRDLTGRTGFLLFSVNLGTGGQIGYNLSAQHVIGNHQVASHVIPAEEAELMHDPIEGFLGWQANKKEPGRLFNAPLMHELLATINSYIAAVRASNGVNINAASQMTSETAMASQPQMAPGSIDPMLASQAQVQYSATNPGAIMGGNQNPFQTPPAAQIDPISQQPVPQPGAAPFISPAFAQAGGDLPF